MGLRKRMRSIQYKEEQIHKELLKRIKEDLKKQEEMKDDNSPKDEEVIGDVC